MIGAPPDDEGNGDQELDVASIDRYLEVLSDRRRRIALDRLLSEGRIEVEALVSHVADRERSGNENSGRRVDIEFAHVHIPKLCDAGLVRLEDGTLHFDGSTPLVRDLVEVLSSYEDRIDTRTS